MKISEGRFGVPGVREGTGLLGAVQTAMWEMEPIRGTASNHHTQFILKAVVQGVLRALGAETGEDGTLELDVEGGALPEGDLVPGELVTFKPLDEDSLVARALDAMREELRDRVEGRVKGALESLKEARDTRAELSSGLEDLRARLQELEQAAQLPPAAADVPDIAPLRADIDELKRAVASLTAKLETPAPSSSRKRS